MSGKPMWNKLGIRTQLVILISVLLTMVQLGAFGLTYWIDIKERQSLAIDQTATLVGTASISH